MIFSCTNKVLNKLKSQKTISEDKQENSLFNWYVDLINLERKTYFLFTNSKTLFSFIIYMGTKKEQAQIEILFVKCLKEMLVREYGIQPKYFDLIDINSTEFKFTKTNSRSILGSMNDFKLNIKGRVERDGLAIETYNSINHFINQMPMGTLKYGQPFEVNKIELDKLTN